MDCRKRLIGGIVTSAISWRASFGLQVLVVGWIILLARRITDPAGPEAGATTAKPRFDVIGAVLPAAGLFFVVLGLLQARTYGFGASRADFTIGSTVVIPKGEISGLSRSVSNLGSSLGTTLVGATLVASLRPAGQPFAIAMIVMLVFSLIGLALGVFIPRRAAGTEQPAESTTAGAL